MSAEQPTERRSQIESTDLDEARDYLQSAYDGSGFEIEPTSSDFRFRYTIAGDDDMTLRSSLFMASITGSVEMHGEYVVSWLRAGRGRIDVGGDELAMSLDTPSMFPTGRRYSFEFADYRQNLVHFSAALLERVAVEHGGGTRGALHFDHAAVPSSAALARWTKTIASVAETLLGGHPAPLLRSEENRRAAVVLLETFPHRLAAPTASNAAAGNARLQQAIDFVQANSNLPISTTEIAESVGVSVRALQLAFSRHLDTTPMEYLRELRLDRVHAELVELGPGETTVAAVASRWGFGHLGRFSAAYSNRFGEYPTTTLRRRP